MDDISSYIIKPFPFSRDGVKEEFAAPGKTIDIPYRLFDGLNREGYLRRAVIGDGHVTLHSASAATEPTEPVLPPAAAVEVPAAPEPPVAAPQPPAKTSDLTEGEQEAIADGSWRTLKFFAKRSIAAKLSDQPIKDGADADAAIELYIESKGAL